MRVVDYQKEIKESESELKVIEKQQTNARLLVRVQFLRFLKREEAAQIKKVSEILGMSAKHGYQLWKKYQAEGLVKYLQLNYQPKQSRMGAEAEQKLMARAEAGGFSSQLEAQAYIEQEFGIKYTQQGISHLFGRLQMKAKVVRPFNIKADRQAQAEYKKSFL
jgi:transposase